MLGMHGTYEANMAMHDCDVMINIGARFDDRITGPLDAFSPNSKKIHIDIDPSSINKNVHVDVRSSAMSNYVLEDMVRIWRARRGQARRQGISRLVEDRSTSGAPENSLAYSPKQRRDHAAIRDPASLRR